jgi:hypothetical protein
LHPENITLVLCTHLIGLESSARVLTSHVLKHCSSRYTCPNSGWPAGSHAGHGGRHRSRVRGDAPVAFVPSETRRRPPIERRTRMLNHLACAAPQPCNAVHPFQYWLTRLQPPVVDSMLAGAVLLPLALPDSSSSIPGLAADGPCRHPGLSIAAHTWWHLQRDIAGAGERLLVQSYAV